MTHTINYEFGQGFQVGLSKLIIFGILYYSVVWCGRIYRSQMHNFVINQHRQNALSTFETFVKAASDQQIKDAVLLQATQSIFSPQGSAFSDKDTGSDGSPKILEIIRGVNAVTKIAEKK